MRGRSLFRTHQRLLERRRGLKNLKAAHGDVRKRRFARPNGNLEARRKIAIEARKQAAAAREQNTIGISSRDLAEQIAGSVFFETLPEVTDYLRQIARPGDLILTVGAGDIYTVADTLTKDETM